MKLSREHSRTLQIALETFARQATTVLTSALRAVCQVTLVSVEQQTYDEYVEALANPTYMTLFSVEPMPGSGVLQMPLAATMGCVDHLLGGPGGPQQPQRPLTEIESTVVQGLTTRLLAEIRYAFAALVPLDPTISGVEYSPQFAQVVAPSDAVVVATFDLRQGEADHVATICLPFAGLLPFLTAAAAPGTMSERERAQRAHASAQLSSSFEQVPVDVSVRFRPTTADPGELAELRPGDVVRLQHPAAAPLDVTAANVVFAHATAGAQGKRLACLVVASPSKEN